MLSTLPRRYKQRLGLHRRQETPPPPAGVRVPRARVHNNDSGYGSDTSMPDSTTAAYLNQKIAEYKAAGPARRSRGESAKQAAKTEGVHWSKFCKELVKQGGPVIDSIDQLRIAAENPEIFKTYLDWRWDNSRIKKLGSLKTYWHNLSSFYITEVRDFIKSSTLSDVEAWLPQFGVDHELDDSDKEKSRLYVDDLATLLMGHWVDDKHVFAHERLRLHEVPINVFSAGTATRPQALLGKEKPVLYENIEFQVFPPPPGGVRNRIVLILNLTNIKRSGGRSKPKKFAFYEGENISCCPVLPVLSMAFADNAFADDFTYLDELYALVVPNDRDRLRFKWKPEWVKRPVFRDIERTSTGTIRISLTKPLSYKKHRDYLILLGRTCGYRKKLQCYDFRRASGKKMNEALTPEERRNIMGNRGDVYERYYLPTFIDADCQAIYFGTTRREYFIEAIGKMERRAGAPVELSDAQNAELEIEMQNDEEIIELLMEREKYKEIIKEIYPTIKSSIGTPEFDHREDIIRKLNTRKQKLRSDKLEKVINHFHDTVDSEEIRRQQAGILPSTDSPSLPPRTYEVKERAAIVQLLFSRPLNDLDELEMGQLRLKLSKYYTQLCFRQETPRQYRQPALELPSPPERLSVHTTDSPRMQQNPAPSLILSPQPRVPDLICLFCKWDDEAGSHKRSKVFSRTDALTRHIHEQHLKYIPVGYCLPCPDRGCSAILGSTMHILGHISDCHGLQLGVARQAIVC